MTLLSTSMPSYRMAAISLCAGSRAIELQKASEYDNRVVHPYLSLSGGPVRSSR